MPKTKKTVKKTKTVKKRVVSKKKPTVRVSKVKSVEPKMASGSFSPEFTNSLLVIFGMGMVLFAYVLFRVYG